ncbi:MAG: hypothetical protein PVS2B2_07860 [Candidatus Acidiferrum sp.]
MNTRSLSGPWPTTRPIIPVIGTNRAVPILYPKLKKKFGDTVSYEQDPLAHVKTEFGFDVLQVAKERYAPDSYHDFIGFEVSRSLLDRAFCETYGLELNAVLLDEDKALMSYRRDVSKLIPKATRIAWSLKKKEIKDDIPDMTRKKFLFNLKRAQFNRQWGKDYQRPGAGDRFLAFLFRLIPKIGPLHILEFRTPTPATEKMFEESFNSTLDGCKKLLEQAGNGLVELPNDNFDVGEQTAGGKYALNDETHADLLHKLAQQDFSNAPVEIRTELLIFFGDPAAAYATRQDAGKWARLQTELQQLKSAQTGSIPAVN